MMQRVVPECAGFQLMNHPASKVVARTSIRRTARVRLERVSISEDRSVASALPVKGIEG